MMEWQNDRQNKNNKPLDLRSQGIKNSEIIYTVSEHSLREISWIWILYRANPKSATLTTVLCPTKQLRAAKSLWINLLFSKYAIPLQTCEHMSSNVAVLLSKRALCRRKYESNEPTEYNRYAEKIFQAKWNY